MVYRNLLISSCIAVVLLCAASPASSVSLERAIFKLSFVKDSEKVQRVRAFTEDDSVTEVAKPEGFEVDVKDALSVQASFVNAEGEPVFVQQVFLRFENLRTGLDNLFLLKKKGREVRADISLQKEVKSDLDFWTPDDTYAVELVMGDTVLDRSVSWTITEAMKFSEDSRGAFTKKIGGVFDFDVSVKKHLLPEFISPVPVPEKRAHPAVILAALILVILPLPLLLVAWAKLGVFPLEFPKDKGSQLSAVGFEACMVGHLAALAMFWLRWNIITTWKVMGVLMVPTLIFGHRVLSTGASKR